MKILLSFLSAILLLLNDTFPQRLIDRNFIINPLFSGKASVDFNAFGEFGMYRIQRDNSHSWLQKLGIVIDFYKTSDFSFSGISSIEFISDPHNDIRFNPRAIFWDEGFFITKKLEKNFLQVGYYHRCKHDVDNLFNRYERTLIYGSVSIKYIVPKLLSNNFDNLLQFKTDFYTLKYDHKFPKIITKESYDKLISSFGTNLHNSFTVNPSISLLLNLNFIFSLYSNNKDFLEQFTDIHSTSFNYGISTGIEIGEKKFIKFLLNYEYNFDAGIELEPSKSKLFYLSALFSDSVFK